MPTALRSGPYRVYFFSHESNEPAHVHIDRDQASCNFWLSPVPWRVILDSELRNDVTSNGQSRITSMIC